MRQWLPLLCMLSTLPALVLAAPQAPTRHDTTTSAQPSTRRPSPPPTRPSSRAAAARPASRPTGPPTPLYHVDSPAQSAPPPRSALGRILKSQAIRFCIRTDVPPFGYFTNAGLTGFDVHLAKEVAIQLSIFYKKNLHISWITINAGARISSLQQNQCDVVAAAFSYTPARARLIAFSTPYLKTDKVVVANADITRSQPITALVRGTTNSAKGLKGKALLFNNYSEIIFAMEQGAVDYIVTDRPIAMHMMRSVTRNFQIAKAIPHYERYALGINKANKALQDAINRALRSLAHRGRLAYLHRQWL